MAELTKAELERQLKEMQDRAEAAERERDELLGDAPQGTVPGKGEGLVTVDGTGTVVTGDPVPTANDPRGNPEEVEKANAEVQKANEAARKAALGR